MEVMVMIVICAAPLAPAPAPPPSAPAPAPPLSAPAPVYDSQVYSSLSNYNYTRSPFRVSSDTRKRYSLNTKSTFNKIRFSIV